MRYFDTLADMGFMVVCRRNRLGTTTMFAVRKSDTCPEDGGFSGMLDGLPEWRVVDFSGDDAAAGAKLLYEKLTVTGMYANWDEKMVGYCLPEMRIGFENRPAEEQFEPVAGE